MIPLDIFLSDAGIPVPVGATIEQKIALCVSLFSDHMAIPGLADIDLGPDKFKYNGLKVTYETTKKIGLNALFMPLEVAALLAHENVVNCVNRKEVFWVKSDVLSELRSLFPEPGYYAIKIGCLAYCALHSSYKSEREAAEIILNNAYNELIAPTRRLLYGNAAAQLGV